MNMDADELLASHTHWNVLKFFGVADIPSLAEKLIDTLPCGDAETQLRARKIQSIRLISMSTGHALLVPILSGDKEHRTLDYFRVALRRDDTIKEWVFSVAHKLGHTFAFGRDINRPFGRMWSRKECCDCEEVFANEFMRQWLSKGSNEKELFHLLSLGLLRKK